MERVRARFAYLEPCGVGAKDVKESFLFQLGEAEASEEIIECAKKIILNFENIEKLRKLKFYDDALKNHKKNLKIHQPLSISKMKKRRCLTYSC